MNFTIRPTLTTDIDVILSVNKTAVPALSTLVHKALVYFLEIANHFMVIITGDRKAGFLTALSPKTTYQNVKYR